MLGQRKMKCVCVGDAGVGKSSLLMAFATNSFLSDTIPALCRNYNISIVVCDIDRNEGETARVATYCDADVVLLCFSAINRNSYDNITARWTDELQKHLPNTPIVLVCTNIDRRQPEYTSHISHQQGLDLKEKIGAIAYLECSACARSGLREVFEAAVKSSKPNTISKKNGKRISKGGCLIQ